MYPLAFELWIYVIRHLSRRDLISASEACSIFRSIAQTQLFRDVSLKKEKDLVLFARSLAEGRQLTSLVYALRMGSVDMEVLTSHPLFRHISSLSNLHTLYLRRICIDSELCVALQNLRRLKEITFTLCKIDPDLDAPNTQTAWGRNLSTVFLNSPQGSETGWDALIPRTIRTLKVVLSLFPNSDGPQFSMDNLVTTLISRSTTFEITSLTLPLDYRKPGSTIRFLISCPQLRNLTLHVRSDKANPSFSSFPPHALPMLEHFLVPPNLMETLVTGRRIRSLDCYLTPEDPDNALVSLRRSLIPVTKMRLGAPKIRVEWLRYLPHTLHFLEVTQFSQDISWITALPKMSTLCTLGIITPHVSAEEQEELVETLSVMFDSLQELVFEWHATENDRLQYKRCTWRRRPELPWESYPYSLEQ